MATLKTFCLALSIWLFGGPLAIGAAWANTTPGDGILRFDVALDGRPIGTHSLTFTPRPDGSLAVSIDIDLEIRFGPFTMFEYTHRNRTAWRDGQLLSLESETDDNGERHWVQVVRDDDRLTIRSDQADAFDVAPTMLPTTYWMASTVRQAQLINSQTGELLDVSVTRVGAAPVDGPAGTIPATHYRMDGDLEIDLWYDADGVLVGLAFVARGAQVTYRLAARNGDIPVSMAGNIMNARR